MALSHEIIEELVCLALTILGSKDPLKSRLLTVCICRHSEETLALGLTCALIKVLFDMQHVSLSIVLANVVSAHGADRHGISWAHHDCVANEGSLLDRGSKLASKLSFFDVVDAADSVNIGELPCTVHSGTDYAERGQRRSHHQRQHGHVGVEHASQAERAHTVEALRAKHFGLEDRALESTCVNHGVHCVHTLHLIDKVHVGLVKPAEVLALELAREKLVLIDGAVLNLIHLVQLSLELDKLLAALRLSVYNTLLVFL